MNPSPKHPPLLSTQSGCAHAIEPNWTQTTREPGNPWRSALESAGAGIWVWNMQTNQQSHSARWEQLIGYSGDELPQDYSAFFSRVHPDDVGALNAAGRNYREGHAPRFSVDLRLRCKDGSWKWISSSGMIVSHDDAGRPLLMIGTHTDISERKQAEQALQELNTVLNEKTSVLQTTLTHISQGILVFDAGKHIIGFNPRVCELLEVPADFLAQRPTLGELSQLQHNLGVFGPGASRVAESARAYVMSDGMGEPPAAYLRESSGGQVLEVKTKMLPDGGMVRTFADVTDYIKAQTALRENEERWKLALESTGDGVWDWHIQTGEEFLSPSLLRMYGLTAQDIENNASALDERTHPDDVAQLHRNRQVHFDGHSPTYINEHRIRCADGSWKWVLTRGMVISRDTDGKPLRMIGTHTDISQRKAAEATIWQQANFDSLTSLPNRRLLRERLLQELKKCRRDGLQLALLYIDLDRFKEINDTLGHDLGDVLLVQAAQRIAACLREVDTVARMGGDEFTVIVTSLQQASDLENVLQKLLTALSAVFHLDTEQAFISASIGVTIYPDDAQDLEDLQRNADQALYVAKDAGRNRYSFFTPALQQAAQWRSQLTQDLRTALADTADITQFRLVYQPIVELASGAVYKAEALLRWQHPLRGLISPAEFIPVAESSRLIVELGEWVFQQACEQVQQWRTTMHPHFQISVNKSPVQFESPNPLHLRWSEQLRRRGLGGDSIAVEITEGLLLSTSDSVLQQLLDMGQDGIQVSLDDFGTGYSSLSYLQKFDIDYLKIDQSFVRQLATNPTSQVLCHAIIAMAHALGLKVIAEGVETEPQHHLLRRAGCDFAQGYLFSRPVPAAGFEQVCQKISSLAAPDSWIC